jgi:hypothetical protein
MFLPLNCAFILHPFDPGIIHAAETHYGSQLLIRMLATISVGRDENINNLEALQKFSLEEIKCYSGVKLLV